MLAWRFVKACRSILSIGDESDDIQSCYGVKAKSCQLSTQRGRPHSCIPDHSGRAVKFRLKSKLYDMTVLNLRYHETELMRPSHRVAVNLLRTQF